MKMFEELAAKGMVFFKLPWLRAALVKELGGDPQATERVEIMVQSFAVAAKLDKDIGCADLLDLANLMRLGQANPSDLRVVGARLLMQGVRDERVT